MKAIASIMIGIIPIALMFLGSWLFFGLNVWLDWWGFPCMVLYIVFWVISLGWAGVTICEINGIEL